MTQIDGYVEEDVYLYENDKLKWCRQTRSSLRNGERGAQSYLILTLNSLSARSITMVTVNTEITEEEEEDRGNESERG